MDIIWIVLAGCLFLAGILGSILPLLPGPPLSYLGLLVMQLLEKPPFTVKFMIIWLLIVIVVAILDYVVPLYGTKKYGGSAYGIWGCAIGLIVGLWFGPIGIILGPVLGAFVGEMMANNSSEKALRAALGSFIGFLFSTLLKLITSLVMTWYFIMALF